MSVRSNTYENDTSSPSGSIIKYLLDRLQIDGTPLSSLYHHSHYRGASNDWRIILDPGNDS